MFDICMRIIKEGEYIVEKGATVRAAAEYFGVSKSSVHKDVTERLKEIDCALYEEVREILNKNLAERHIRGGQATRNRYHALKENMRKLT